MRDSDFPYRLHGFGSLCGPSGLPMTRELVEDQLVGFPKVLAELDETGEVSFGVVKIVDVRAMERTILQGSGEVEPLGILHGEDLVG